MLRRSLGVSDAEALHIGPGISFRSKILCSLCYRATFALWIELASGSDVERKIVDQDYGEAWLTSLVKMRCQDQEPGLGLGLGFWKAVGAGYWYVWKEGPSPRLG